MTLFVMQHINFPLLVFHTYNMCVCALYLFQLSCRLSVENRKLFTLHLYNAPLPVARVSTTNGWDLIVLTKQCRSPSLILNRIVLCVYVSTLVSTRKVMHMFVQGHNQKFISGGVFSRPFLFPSLPSLFPLFSLPRSGPSNPAKGFGGALAPRSGREHVQPVDTFPARL